MRRRRVTYPPPKTATAAAGQAASAADARAAAAASRTVSINLQAMTGRSEIKQGGRVQITSGLYAGEMATVESIVGGVIPAAAVRTDAGRTRRVRTIDLIPAPVEQPPSAAPVEQPPSAAPVEQPPSEA